MARIRIKYGANEIEIDSRDFYLDNDTAGDVIAGLARHMNENSAKIVEAGPGAKYGLDSLENAEAFEPEFDEPRHIEPGKIRAKLGILELDGFFDAPRTVGETVQRMRESGWIASSLDVSKVLARMATDKEISKGAGEDRTCYAKAGMLAH